MSVGLIVALGSYLLSTFARAVDWLKDWDFLSLIHYYDTTGLRDGSFHLTNIWVYLAVVLLTVMIAIIVFRRRNIA